MSSTLGRLGRDVLIYGTGDFVVKALGLIALPLYTRLLTPEEYGIWSYVVTGAALFAGIVALGGDSAFARSYFAADSEDRRQLITSTWLGFLVVWSAAVAVLSLAFVGDLSRWSFGGADHRDLLVLSALSIPLRLLNTMCGQVLRNEFRAGAFCSLNLAGASLELGAALVAAVGCGLGLAGLFWGSLAAQVVQAPVRLWSVRHMLRFRFSAAVLGELLAYGVPLVPMSLAYWIFGSADRLMLLKLCGAEQAGWYAVANSLVSPLIFLCAALGQAWSPHAFQIYHGEPSAAPRLFGRVATYIVVATGLLGVLVSASAPEALAILAPPEFAPAAAAIGPLALGAIAYASTQVTASGMALSGKTGYISLHAWLAALLNVALNLLLIPRYGMAAAAWSTAASYVYLTLAFLLTSQRLWRVDYEGRRVAVVLGAVLAVLVVVPNIPRPSAFVGITIALLAVAAYTAVTVACGAIGRREWVAIRSLFSARKVATTDVSRGGESPSYTTQ